MLRVPSLTVSVHVTMISMDMSTNLIIAVNHGWKTLNYQHYSMIWVGHPEPQLLRIPFLVVCKYTLAWNTTGQWNANMSICIDTICITKLWAQWCIGRFVQQEHKQCQKYTSTYFKVNIYDFACNHTYVNVYPRVQHGWQLVSLSPYQRLKHIAQLFSNRLGTSSAFSSHGLLCCFLQMLLLVIHFRFATSNSNWLLVDFNFLPGPTSSPQIWPQGWGASTLYNHSILVRIVSCDWMLYFSLDIDPAECLYKDTRL